MNDSGRDLDRNRRQKLVKQIYLLKEEHSKISLKIDQLETKLMDKCPHHFEALRESNVQTGWSASPPIRVCVDCGYAEEGWGSGFWKLAVGWELHDSIPRLERDVAFKFVRKFWTQDAMDKFRYPRNESAK